MTTKINTAQRATQARSLRPRQGAQLLGIGLSTFWAWTKQKPNFPAPRRLSARCTVFDEHELVQWRDTHLAGDAR